MSRPPLDGRSVVVTRARSQASRMVERLSSLGASVVELPVIATDDPVDGGAALRKSAERLVAGGYGWVALTSANAATRLLDAVGRRDAPGALRWAALGEGTAGVLRAAGVEPAVVAEVASSAGLVDAFPPVTVGTPAAVLFPRAETVRGSLAEGLRAKGWVVEEVVAYRTVAATPAADSVERALHADAIAFTSSSTVEHAVALLGLEGVPPTVASIGPATSSTARAAGLHVTVEADPHTIDGLVEALAQVLGGTGGTAGGGPRGEGS